MESVKCEAKDVKIMAVGGSGGRLPGDVSMTCGESHGDIMSFRSQSLRDFHEGPCSRSRRT